MLKKPTIVCAAMLMDDGLIVPGVRHFSPEMRVVLKRIYGKGFKLFKWWIKKPYHLRVKEQGFIDQFGNFYSRKAAWRIADINGQICLYDPAGKGKKIPQPANQGDIKELFSENLY